MSVQTIPVTAASNRVMAARGVAFYFWTQYQRFIRIIAAAWFIAAMWDYVCYRDQVHSITDAFDPHHVLTMIVIPILFVTTPMLVSTMTRDHFWTLPVRTKTLIAVLMCCASGSSVFCWILSILCIWRPAGLDAPILWPSALIIAIHASNLATRYNSNPLSYLVNIYVTYIGVFLCLYPQTGPGFSSLELTGEFLTLAGWMYASALSGAVKSRQGAKAAFFPQWKALRRRSLAPTFASPIQAQIWMEKRRELPVFLRMIVGMPLMSFLIFLVTPLTMAVWPVALFTHYAHQLYTRSGFLINIFSPVFVLPLYSLIMSPDLFGIQRRIHKEMDIVALRPLDHAAWAAAKLRVFGLVTAIVWAVEAVILTGWALMPAWLDGKATRLGTALWNTITPRMDAHAVFAALVALLGMIVFTWKVQVDHLFLVTLRRSPLIYGAAVLAIGALYLSIGAYAQHISNEGIYAWAYKRTDWTPFSPEMRSVCTSLLVMGTPLKLALTVFLIGLIRRRRLLPDATLCRILISWVSAALLLTVLFCWAFTPYGVAWRYIALSVLLFMPGTRLALAVLTRTWDRCR